MITINRNTLRGTRDLHFVIRPEYLGSRLVVLAVPIIYIAAALCLSLKRNNKANISILAMKRNTEITQLMG